MNYSNNNGDFVINLTGQKILFATIDSNHPLFLSEKIGAGTYGDVYKAHVHGVNNSKIYAVKYYREETRSLRGEGLNCTTIRELSGMQELIHANVLKLEGLYLGEDKNISAFINDCYSEWLKHGNAEIDGYPILQGQAYVFAAYEYCPGGDIKKVLSQRKQENPLRSDLWGLPLLDTKFLIYQLLNGLSYLHNGKMCHRDLKPDNLMLDRPGLKSVLKIGDLGLCRDLRSNVGELTPTICTIYYRPLEVLLGRMRMSEGSNYQYETADQNGLSPHYGLAVDIWSSGCILGEMITGRAIFKGTQEFEVFARITKVLGTPSEEQWKNCTTLQYFPHPIRGNGHFFNCKDKIQHLNCLMEGKLDIKGLDLLSRMLEYNPNTRITAAEALSHDWFSDINFGMLDGIGVYNWLWQTFQYQIEGSSHPLRSDVKKILATSEVGHILYRDSHNNQTHPLLMSIAKHLKRVQKQKQDQWKSSTVLSGPKKFSSPFMSFKRPLLGSRKLPEIGSCLTEDRNSPFNQCEVEPNTHNIAKIPRNPIEEKKRRYDETPLAPTTQQNPNFYHPKDVPKFPNLQNSRNPSVTANTKNLDEVIKQNNLKYNPNSIFSNKLSTKKSHIHSYSKENDENKNTENSFTAQPQKTDRAVRSTTRAQTILSYSSKGTKPNKTL